MLVWTISFDKTLRTVRSSQILTSAWSTVRCSLASGDHQWRCVTFGCSAFWVPRPRPNNYVIILILDNQYIRWWEKAIWWGETHITFFITILWYLLLLNRNEAQHFFNPQNPFKSAISTRMLRVYHITFIMYSGDAITTHIHFWAAKIQPEIHPKFTDWIRFVLNPRP